MLGLVHAATLFQRGPQSVRIVRLTRADGPARLLIHGPGAAHEVHVMENAIECLWRQTDIERRLVAEGFRLVPLPGAERRSGRERRATTRGSDRRRPAVEMTS